MATVVSITNPITGAVEQVDKLDHTAQQIDDAVARVAAPEAEAEQAALDRAALTLLLTGEETV